MKIICNLGADKLNPQINDNPPMGEDHSHVLSGDNFTLLYDEIKDRYFIRGTTYAGSDGSFDSVWPIEHAQKSMPADLYEQACEEQSKHQNHSK